MHFLDTPQVANSELKCVIQYYMSGRLRKDVKCKWKLGGQEAEAAAFHQGIFASPAGAEHLHPLLSLERDELEPHLLHKSNS